MGHEENTHQKISLFKDLKLDPKKYKGVFLSKQGWGEVREDEGRRRLSSRLIGLCTSETIRSVEEIAQVLMDLRACDSIESGRKLVERLYGTRISYGNKYTLLSPVQDINGRELVRVYKGKEDDYWD